MKALFSILSFFILTFLSAQPRFICAHLSDSSLNYLYIGADNQLNVAGTNIPAGYTLSITGDGASLTKYGDYGGYLVTVKQETDDIYITLLHNKKQVLRRQFKARIMPPFFVAMAGNYRDTTISRSRLFLNPYLVFTSPGNYYNLQGMVLSFTCSMMVNGDSVYLSANGNQLNTEQLKKIKELPSGSVILFENIRGMVAGGCLRKYPNFWIKIE